MTPLEIVRETRAVDRSTVRLCDRLSAVITRDGVGRPWRAYVFDSKRSTVFVGEATGPDEHAALAAALLDAVELADAIRAAMTRAAGGL